MLANNERLSKGTDRLKNAHQVTLDMENTANSILGDLSKQRETRYARQGHITATRWRATTRAVGSCPRWLVVRR